MVVVILIVAALLCFLLAAVGTNPSKVSLTPLGLAFVAGAMLYPMIA